MNIKNTIISAVFVLIGILLISYAFNRHCDVGDITQTIGDKTTVIEQPVEMNRMVCLSTDFVAVISVLLGAASVFPGVSGLHRALTGEKK